MGISPFIHLESTSGKTLMDNELIAGFNYKYSEEEDDVAEILIHTNNVLIADDPDFQEGKLIKVTWGYLDGTRAKQTRLVYIYETKTEYAADGIKLTITGHEKFANTKMDIAPAVNPSTSKEDASTLIISPDVLKNIKMDKSNIEGLQELFNVKQGNKLQPKSSIMEARVVYGNNDSYTNLREGLSYDQLSRMSGPDALSITMYNGNLPTFRGLRSYFDKLPGGPYVIEGRDDSVIIRTRDFTQNSGIVYSYAADPGGLLEFSPETKNRSKGTASNKVKVTGWDSENKTPIKSISEEPEPTTNSTSSLSDSLPWWYELYAPPLHGSPEWFKLKQEEREKARVIGPKQSFPITKNWDAAMGLEDIIKKQENLEPTIPKEIGGTGNYYKNLLLGENTKNEHELGKNISVGAMTDLEEGQGLADNIRGNEKLENNPASAKMVGNPAITTGMIIEIQGVSAKHAGLYYIKECAHVIDDQGYITTISSMVRPGPNQTKKKVPVQKPEEGIPIQNTKDGKPVTPAPRRQWGVIGNNQPGSPDWMAEELDKGRQIKEAKFDQLLDKIYVINPDES